CARRQLSEAGHRTEADTLDEPAPCDCASHHRHGELDADAPVDQGVESRQPAAIELAVEPAHRAVEGDGLLERPVTRLAPPLQRPIRVKCASAPMGVGNERLAAWSKVPSRVTSRHPDMPMPGLSSMSRTMWSSAPSLISVSGFSTRTYGASTCRSTMLFATQ